MNDKKQNTQSKDKGDMGMSAKLGEDVFNTAKTEINNRATGLVSLAINAVFDWLEVKVKELPESINQLRSNPDIEKETTALWSRELFEEGLIPEAYEGLSDEMILHNFTQTGYIDGLFAGYALAMKALIDNGLPKDQIATVSRYMWPELFYHDWKNAKEDFYDQLKDEKYRWIRETINQSSV